MTKTRLVLALSIIGSACMLQASNALALDLPLAPPAPNISVQGTLAPNFFGSPSFDPWAVNAMLGIETGATTVGAAGPTQFNAINTPVPTSYNFVTGFPSWLGNADPATTYGTAFANELGNRATFDTMITAAPGSKVELANVGFNSFSSDSGNFLGFGFGPGNDPFTSYDQYDIGLIFNGDGTVTVVNSGSADQQVDAIVSVGAGNAPAGYLTDPGSSNQDIINNDLADGPPSYDYTGQFFYDNANGDPLASASATLSFVSDAPDHGDTLSLCGLAGVCLLGFKRAQQQKNQV